MISANEKRPVQGAAEAQERLSTSSDAKYEFFQAKKKKKKNGKAPSTATTR